MSQRTNARPGNPPDVTNEPPSATVLRLAEELSSTDPEREITDRDLAALAVQVSVAELGSVAEQGHDEGLAALAGQVFVADLALISAQISDDDLARIVADAPEAGRYMAAKALGAMPEARSGETRSSYGARLVKAVRGAARDGAGRTGCRS
ncbi:hypothetical protein ACIQZB_00490 [Streptomyces sp. NPDC097727]|uniref:hypothetical protein n=1 Tax=Streptomyces sp. NPDC097727 TaxID=3366092 RepID=UPI00382C40FC